MNMRPILKIFAVTVLAMLSLANQVYAGNAMHIVINDHLGTPQMLVDENRNVVWQAEYDEFGKANILVQQVEFNQRFPGQYYDKETGLHYNYYRDYDSALGRYIQSDPIGLDGGINTYGYVGGNPLKYTDRYGLVAGVDDAAVVVVAGTIAVGVGIACILTGTCDKAAQACSEIAEDIWDSLPVFNESSSSRPFRGEPGSTTSVGGQGRRYGPDGYPETDVDTGHDHGAGDPHAHDWGRPVDGGPPSAGDRGPGRPVQPGDPTP